MDKGTIIRTVALVTALINQVLVLFGKSPLPISDVMVEQITSTVFTVVSSLFAWFGNNYVMAKGKRQKEVLKQRGLSKLKRRLIGCPQY